tara:strand:+ start:669 stop:800 length:132 start_codon:yes stop_codon:yes gene_type:complete
MKEIHELILKEKLKDKPNIHFIKWLQRLNKEILLSIILKEYSL